MKSEPYKQFISRNSIDIAECIQLFHELNHAYHNQFILSLDSQKWEIYDLRTSQPIASFDFKHLKDFRHFMQVLLHDMTKSHVENACYRGNKKLNRSTLYSIKRILNLYGFDEYFFTNRNLINYIVYGEINKE